MKLRQKLAMVLAASMIVTAVPVTTMAYSYNQVHGQVSAVKNHVVKYEDGLRLVMDFEDSIVNKFDLKEASAQKTVDYLNAQIEKVEDIAGEEAVADIKTLVNDGNTVATMFTLSASDFAFSKSLYLNGAGLGIVEAKQALTDLVNELVEGDTKAGSRKFTTGAVVEGTVNVVTKDIQISKSIKADDVVAEVELKVYDENGKAVKKTIEYTRAILETLAKEAGKTEELADAFEAVEGIASITNPLFIIEDNANIAERSTSWNGTVIAEYIASNELRVYVLSDNAADVKVSIPLMGQMTGEAPKVQVQSLDSSSTTSNSTHYLSKEAIGSEKLSFTTVKAENAAKITVNGGVLSNFTIKENVEDVLENGTKIVLDLGKYSDLQFVDESKQEVKLVGKNAFAPSTKNATVKRSADGRYLEMYIPDGNTVGTTVGAWEVSGVKVEAKSLKYGAEVGAVDVTVSSGTLEKPEAYKLFDTTTVTLAEVVDFKVEITAATADLIAGRENNDTDKDKGAKYDEAIITIKEGVQESLDDKRWAYFQMPEDIIVKASEFNDELVAKLVKINGVAANEDDVLLRTDVDKEGNVTGFSLEFEYTNNDEKQGQMVVKKANVITVVVPFCAPLGTEAGEYNVEVISKYLPELEGEIKIAEVVAPVEVTFDQKDVKVGLEKQEMGNITITETADKMIREGDLTIFLDDIKLETAKKDIVLETTEGSKMEVRVKSVESNKNGSTITLAVDKEAKEKAAITIKGLVGTVYRTVPEGGTDILVSGTAILDDHCIVGDKVENDNLNYIKVEDYNAVPTKNTEDINNASKLNTVKITANATSYEVNGKVEQITADLVAFNSAAGKMMAPVRLVGTAFGAEFSFGTINNATVVTFFKDGKAVSFTNGSNVMNVNGVQSVMAEPATIKEGRLFVPLRDLANALGIKVNYDDATKTAEFTNAEK